MGISLNVAQSGYWMLKVLEQFKPMSLVLKTFKLEELELLEQFKPMGLGITTFKLEKLYHHKGLLRSMLPL